jgi:methionyl-tRNA formyltransferase
MPDRRTQPQSAMSVVILAARGRYQQDLVWRLSQHFHVVGIVWHVAANAKGSIASRVRRYLSPVRLWQYIHAQHHMRKSARRAMPLLEALFPPPQPAATAAIPVIEVEDINDSKAAAFVSSRQPDVVCVNGTNLLREPMLALLPRVRHGIINLHTGLSPYSRGGNCDLFMLLEERPEFVGVTIHHIDRGIDSGDILLTARPELSVDDNYDMIEAKSFRLGNDLMVKAVEQLAEGRAQRVPQWEQGKLFLRRTGYVYQPYHRVLVDRKLRRVLSEYLERRLDRDKHIRLVEAESCPR